MVNLLFISNSAKIDRIKDVLQPFLKVRIDIVGDFDFGLKDVFEKRPAIVFIQDQIDGVTGESVARHIQMLLGASAPSFIFMHEGSPKAKLIKGLFEYLIDLSQPDVSLVENVQTTLKTLLGPQWEKIYIPPPMAKTAVKDAVAVPEDNRILRGNSVDGVVPDLDSYKLASVQIPPATGNDQFHVVSSPHDQLAEMLSESSRNSGKESTPVTAHDTYLNGSGFPHEDVAYQQVHQQTLVIPSKATAEITSSVMAQSQAASRNIAPVAPNLTTAPYVSEKTPSLQVSPADFVIGGEEKPADEVAPEELLRVFEGNYYPHTNGWGRFAIIAAFLVMCAGGGVWYLLKQKPNFLPNMIKPSAPQVVVVPAIQPSAPLETIQKPVPVPAPISAVPILPTFIPQSGHDRAYAAQKPGWERYVSTTIEFRVYRPAGKIVAMQVLGVKDNDISEPKLKSILTELCGDGEYRVKSTGQKLGYHVIRAMVGQKADLLIYRKKNAIRAFVVSLD